MLKFLTKQAEAGQVLINVAAETREQARTIISAGGIPVILERLRTGVHWMDPQVSKVNLVWCLMNLARDGEEFRKVLFEYRVNDVLVQNLPLFPN